MQSNSESGRDMQIVNQQKTASTKWKKTAWT